MTLTSHGSTMRRIGLNLPYVSKRRLVIYQPHTNITTCELLDTNLSSGMLQALVQQQGIYNHLVA